MRQFVDIIRWDFTMHRAACTRTFWHIFLAMSIPTVIYLVALLGTALHLWYPGKLVFYAAGSGSESITGPTTSLLGIVQVVCLASMFATLRERSSRLNELMLPASRWKLFVWRAFVALVLVYIIGNLCSLALAGLRYVAAGLLTNFETAQFSIGGSIFGDGFFTPDMNYRLAEKTGGLITHVWQLKAMFFVWLLAGFSPFAFASAWKYRKGLLLGILFHVVVFALFFMIIFSLEAHDVRKEMNPGIILYGMTAGSLFLLAACWWGAWHLYCHAQITTKRNP